MIFFSRSIGPIPINVIIKESHSSTLGLTEVPVETGSKITDNAYIEPKRLELEFADAGGPVTYNLLVQFQETRRPFTIVSGLKIYNNMMIREIHADRDVDRSNILYGGCLLQEVLIVSTTKTSTGGEKAQGIGKTSETKAQGTVTRGDQAAKSVPPSQNTSILASGLGIGSGSPLRTSTPGGVGGV